MSRFPTNTRTHTNTHTYAQTHICIYTCMCVLTGSVTFMNWKDRKSRNDDDVQAGTHINKQTNRQTDIQADKWTDWQTGGQTGRQTDRYCPTHCRLQLLRCQCHVSNGRCEEQVYDIIAIVCDSDIGTVILVVGDAAHAKHSFAAYMSLLSVCVYECVYVCVCVRERVLIMSIKGGVSYDNNDHYQPSGWHKSYY